MTSVRIAPRRAIVQSTHDAQLVANGVSLGESGYGFWAYASSRACAALMPAAKTDGAIPLGGCLGDVTPPATRLRLLARCSPAYAGLSTCVTYNAGETGTENVRVFGSFHAVQRWTHGNSFDAA